MQLFVWCGNTIWNFPQETLEKFLIQRVSKLVPFIKQKKPW